MIHNKMMVCNISSNIHSFITNWELTYLKCSTVVAAPWASPLKSFPTYQSACANNNGTTTKSRYLPVLLMFLQYAKYLNNQL